MLPVRPETVQVLHGFRFQVLVYLSMSDSFFTREWRGDHEWFLPTDHCRGPWHEAHCHAGPPTGLLARAAEQAGAGKRLIRLTVNLLRPVPFAGFLIDCTPMHQGRTLSIFRTRVLDADHRVCAQAEALLLQPGSTPGVATSRRSVGTPEDAAPGDFPIQSARHDLPFFSGSGVQVRYPAGHDGGPGPSVAWLKTVPLLDDETPTPFQRICPLADCGNAFSRNAELSEMVFMNPDLTLVLNRDPEGDWLATDVQGYWESNGMGMSDALLFDRHGVVGRAVQTLLLQRADR